MLTLYFVNDLTHCQPLCNNKTNYIQTNEFVQLKTGFGPHTATGVKEEREVGWGNLGVWEVSEVVGE